MHRLRSRWYDWSQSLWFVPTLMTVAAIGLAVGTVRLDEALDLAPRASRPWAFGGGADGARGVLGTIAGSMITVTGTVFSITIVALQLASGQFTPRVLRTFTGDRGVQVVLGVFLATFTYALLVLRTVRAEEDARTGAEAFVPAVSVTVAVAFALLSIGSLIYFIHRIARAIQAATVVDHVVADTGAALDRRLPPQTADAPTTPGGVAVPDEPPATVRAETSGYLQAVGEGALLDLGTDAPRDAGTGPPRDPRAVAPLTLRIASTVGEFVLEGAPLAEVWPAAACTDRLAGAVRGACTLGRERTHEQDVELGFRQLADIATKALSPGVNDPTTATICVDRLGQLLVRAARDPDGPVVRDDDAGRVRVLLPTPPFGRLVDTAFAQIRHFGAGDAVVMAHLVGVLGRVAELVPPERRAPLAREATLALADARGQLAPHDLPRVDAAAAWLTAGGIGTEPPPHP